MDDIRYVTFSIVKTNLPGSYFVARLGVTEPNANLTELGFTSDYLYRVMET